MGSAMQFMQAGQNMMQQFMDYLGKAGGSAPAAPLPPADPQALTALQKQFMDQQMSLWQAMLVRQQGQEPAFKVAPEPGDRRFSAPEWRESPIYDYVHQAYLLNTQYLKQMIEVLPAQDEKAKERMRFLARQMADAMAPSNFAATNPEFIKLALETKGQSITDGINNLIKDFEKGRISMTDESVFEVGKNIANTEGAVVFENDVMQLIQYAPLTAQGRYAAAAGRAAVHQQVLHHGPAAGQLADPLHGRAGQYGFPGVLAQSAPEGQGHLGWDDYLETWPDCTALHVVQEITKVKQVNALGFCVGGTILTFVAGRAQGAWRKSGCSR
jgi:polyhydroxyalkanoate synthase